MKTKKVKFHGFNLICVVDESEKIWVVVRPICEAVGLDGEWQIKMISEDEILGAERCEHTVQVEGDQPRKMVCLPLEFVSGWLMQIKFTNTMSEETRQNLLKFKRDCYSALFDFFFGKYTKRDQSLKRSIRLQEERKEIECNPNRTAADFDRYIEIGRAMKYEKSLRRNLTIETTFEMKDLFEE